MRMLICLQIAPILLGQASPGHFSPEYAQFEQRVHQEAFRREAAGFSKLLQLPGLSIAVVQDGRIIYRQNEGFADAERKLPIRDDSIFWIASVTKTFSAAIIMQ